MAEMRDQMKKADLAVLITWAHGGDGLCGSQAFFEMPEMFPEDVQKLAIRSFYIFAMREILQGFATLETQL